MRIYKQLLIALVIIGIVLKPLNVYALTTTVSDIDLDSHGITHTDVHIDVTVGATFTVRLPSNIVLSKDPLNDKGVFNSAVGVKGDIEKGKCVEVIPNTSFTIFDVTKRPAGTIATPNSEAEQNDYPHKNPEQVDVNQMETVWKEEEFSTIIKDNGSNFVYDPVSKYHNVNLNIETENKILAGKWEGILPFEIQYGTYYPISATYFNVAEMLSSNQPEGSFIRTKNYDVSGDGGAAVYKVSSTASCTPDDCLSIELDNGMFANLQIEDVVNVAQCGIQPGEDMATKLNNVSSKVVGKAKKIQFNNGIYYVGSPVFLESLEYAGSTDTTLEVLKNFNTYDDKIMLTKRTAGKAYSVDLKNLNFTMETSSEHTMRSKETILVALQDVNQSTVDGCTFVAIPESGDRTPMKVDLLWYKQSESTRNVTVKNTVFRNLTGTACEDKTTYLAGGCLWISGRTNSSEIKNVLIENCEVETTTSDEALAIWRGSSDNVIVNKCHIFNHSHNSDNLVALYGGSFTNTEVKESIIEVGSPTMRITKLKELTDLSEVMYKDCKINVKPSIGTSYSNSVSIFDVAENAGTNSKLLINNCEFTTEADSNYRSILEIKSTSNNKIIMSNSEISGSFNEGVLYLEDANDVTFESVSSNIQTGKNLAVIRNSFNNKIVWSYNIISNKLTHSLQESGTANIIFKDNKFAGNPLSIIFNAINIDSNNGKSHLTLTNNTIASGANYYLFNSNNGVTQNDLLTVQVD